MEKEKYGLPRFLNDICEPKIYKKWLDRVARRHYARDKRRECKGMTPEKYKLAIHKAVEESKGKDAYTGQPLVWKLIGTYDNNEAKKKRKEYCKEGFRKNMPTVDHIGRCTANFKICSWRINDCKSDLDLGEFLHVCETVLKFQESHKKTK
jgi:hypothetical protein